MTTNKRRVSIRRLMDEYAAIEQLRAELGIQAADRTRPVDGMLDDLERAVAAIGQTARGRRVGVRLDVAALAFGERARLTRMRDTEAPCWWAMSPERRTLPAPANDTYTLRACR